MAGVAALVFGGAGAEGIAISLAEGDLGVWGAALAPGVEGLVLGGEVAPIAAVVNAGEEDLGTDGGDAFLICWARLPPASNWKLVWTRLVVDGKL